ncbi:predicted phosphohydrolase, MPP superfamily [Bacteroidales bacterium 6E]|nr:predicted phosphohydrolase, MPP superfamily [Bacteroidales bacterium 6E]
MIFFAIVFFVNLVVNFYIFSKTKALFPAGQASGWILRILFWVLAFSYVIGRFAERGGPEWMATFFVKAGSWWLGAMLYLTLFFLLADLLRGLNSLFHVTDIFKFSWNSDKGRIALIVVYALTAIVLAFAYYNAKIPVVRNLEINVDKHLSGGPQRLVLVSDLHLGMMISNGRLETLVNAVNSLQPDVVLMAGDVFDEDPGPVIRNNMGDLLKNLKARQGVYAVSGNHEYYGNEAEARKYLEDHGITVLSDSTVILPGGIVLVGRQDITGQQMSGKARKSIAELLNGVDMSKPIVMIDHQPYKLKEVSADGVDLQVSGHTHNGQMWPFNYVTNAIFEIGYGYGKIGKTHFYVSSGYGTWGPPIRTNSRSEIVVLELKGKGDIVLTGNE